MIAQGETKATTANHARGNEPEVMRRIVVIDDNADIRGYISDFLKGAGYHVLEAANGSTVIDLLEHHPVDLVITDVVMPIQEGIETIRDVKRLFPGIKIIATSGYPFYLELAEKLGADRVFEKPFEIEKLLVAVRVLLQPHRSVSTYLGAPVRHSEDTSVFLMPNAWQKTA